MYNPSADRPPGATAPGSINTKGFTMHRKFLRRSAYAAFIVFGCLSTNLYASWFNTDDSIRVVENKKPNSNAPAAKYAATIRITGYSDARTGMSPKKVGISTQQISGIWGNELLLDRDVTEVVANSIRKRFDDAGFQLLEDGSALYELSGVVKELTYNAKNRDEIAISLETTLKEAATGKVIWSGQVVEKKERPVDVSGSSKNDIANHLREDLGIVTKKTMDAINATLMALRPDLFNLAPGTKTIAGVTVLQTGASAPAAPPANTGKANASINGTLALTSKPARAKVYLDGIYFGMTPLHAEVEAGIHEVSVKAEKYKTATEKVSIRKSETTELELALER
jgi:hypothetical protein